MKNAIIAMLFTQVFGYGNRAKAAYEHYNGDLELFYSTIKNGDIFLNDMEKEKIFSAEITSFERQYESIIDEGIEFNLLSELPIRCNAGNSSTDFMALYSKGNLDLLSEKNILSFLGTKTPGKYGIMATEKMLSELNGMEITMLTQLTRGLNAYGVDVILNCGGKPILLLPYGINKVEDEYIEQMKQNTLDAGGLLISPFFISNLPLSRCFDIVADVMCRVSSSILITEAGENSRTLKVAKLAIKQSKKVFVVPGNILGTAFKGSNSLINNGGLLAEDSGYVARGLGVEDSKIKTIIKSTVKKAKEKSTNYSIDSKSGNSISTVSENKQKLPKFEGVLPIHEKIFNLILTKPLTLDQLCEYIDEETGFVMTAITILEAYGILSRTADGKYIAAASN